MCNILKDFSDFKILNAIEMHQIEQLPLLFSHSSHIEVRNKKDMIYVVSDIRHPHLNWVVKARLETNKINERIDSTINYFKSRRLPFIWIIGPSTQPFNLGDRLVKNGFTHIKYEIGMAVDLSFMKKDHPMIQDLTISQVYDTQTLKDWIQTIVISYEYSEVVSNFLFNLYTQLGFGKNTSWKLYVGYLNGKPVASSRLLFAAGVAGISDVGTIPAARRQGIGIAISFAPLIDAYNMGYSLGVLRSTPMGLGVYNRIGFKEYCKFDYYLFETD